MDIVHSDVNLVGWKSLFTAFACANAQRWFSRNGRSGRSHMETGFRMLGGVLFLFSFLGLTFNGKLVTRTSHKAMQNSWKWFWRWSNSRIDGSHVDVLLLCLTRNFWSRHVISLTKFLRQKWTKERGKEGNDPIWPTRWRTSLLYMGIYQERSNKFERFVFRQDRRSHVAFFSNRNETSFEMFRVVGEEQQV